MSSHTEAFVSLREFQRAMTPTAWTTPQDIHQHRAALVRALCNGSASYPDAFVYPPIAIDDVDRLARSTTTACSGLSETLRGPVLDEVARQRSRAHAIASRDDDRLTEWEMRRGGAPSDALVQAASLIVDSSTTPLSDQPSRRFSSLETASVMEAALAAVGCEGWTVQIQANMAARASVNGGLQRVRLRSDVQLTEGEVRRLVVHEIGGHVLRWVNSRAQPEPFLAAPLGNTVPTEEGLAALLEERMNVADNSQTRTYALRVLAVHWAQQHPLLEVARLLQRHMGVEDAADLAIRVKLGMVDPQRPGGPTKDKGYLQGLLELRSVAIDSPHDIDLLRCSKWPMELLPQLRELELRGGLQGPHVVARRSLLLAGMPTTA